MFTSSKTVIELGVHYSVIAFSFTLIIVVGVTFEKIFQAVGNMKTTMISLMWVYNKHCLRPRSDFWLWSIP